jgi:hypothetical protein
MAVFPFVPTATPRAARVPYRFSASRQSRPALVMRWEQDAHGHLVCRWVFAASASPISPPY